MKMNEKLNEIFNLEKDDTDPLLPTVVPPQVQQEDDFELARNTMRNLISKNQTVIDSLTSLAQNSESARVYEVAGQLIKAQSEIAKDLLTIHKTKKDITGESSNQNIGTQNNIVFTGPTSDLLKMISAERAKIIDSK
jgi:hypothetical protein